MIGNIPINCNYSSFRIGWFKNVKVQKSDFLDTKFALPTTNVAEIFLNDLRKSISPVNLEEQMFLKLNRRFWDIKIVVKSQIRGP